ncbi:MAG: DUF1800 domain-containing protein [Flavobacteriales bacterium]|nr:DUF1800 domain-containing protein [Flavobacteriales bacterium]
MGTTALDHRQRIKLLYGRAAMGISPSQLAALEQQPFSGIVEDLFAGSAEWKPLETAQRVATLKQYRAMSEKDQRAFRREQRNNTAELNVEWMQRLSGNAGILREKMTLFWHGHFACRSKWGLSTQQLNNVLRQHALGNFGALLRGVSRSPAMLEFLDNHQNRRGAPNENFAREVMELFTIGRGNYTEPDIRESARAFTGWSFRLETGEFVFNEEQHDFGEKTFRGHTGRWDGDDILGFLLDDERTAAFISRKIYRWFVQPEVDEAFVGIMAKRFFGSGYDIEDLMRFLFTSEHFAQERNLGARIKNPVELLAGLDHLFNIVYELPDQRIALQRALGQVLFFPPNVAGWAEGKAWIDSNSLQLRLRMPSVLLNNGALEWEPDGSDPEGLDAAMMMDAQGDQPQRDGKGRVLRTASDKEQFVFGLPKEMSNDGLCEALLAIPPSQALRSSISPAGQGSVFDRVLQVLSSPEYQLC